MKNINLYFTLIYKQHKISPVYNQGVLVGQFLKKLNIIDQFAINLTPRPIFDKEFEFSAKKYTRYNKTDNFEAFGFSKKS